MKNSINIVTVIQARMNSTRLPHKVFMSLAGQPLLKRMVERVKASRFAGTVVVATTIDKSDDPVYELCTREGINVFRGHESDLLDRHYHVGLEYNADAVVKIPSDCPLIDPAVIDKVLKFYIDNRDNLDYVSNLHPATYPDGNDVEVFHMSCLKDAWENAARPLEREHTTPYFWENPNLFKTGNVIWESGLDYSMSHRFTIDYEEDYLFIKRVYDELYPSNKNFGLYDIISLLDSYPEIKKINEKYAGVNWYRNHLNELKTVSAEQTKVI